MWLIYLFINYSFTKIYTRKSSFQAFFFPNINALKHNIYQDKSFTLIE